MPSRNPPAHLLSVAVGNSHTRLTLQQGQDILSPFEPLTTDRLSAASARSTAQRSGLRPGADVLLGGVVPKALDLLERSFRKEGYRVWRFRRNLPCPLKIVPKPARQVGDDRLAAALGALGYDDARPWIVVDSGTALTVNAVRPAKGKYLGVFEGGLIMPGEGLSLLALHRGTAQLPDLEPWPPSPLAKLPAIGRSTQEAIRAGVRRQQVAAIVAAVEAQAKELGPHTRVMITGGGLDNIFQALFSALKRFRPDVEDNLVSLGLLVAFRHGRPENK